MYFLRKGYFLFFNKSNSSDVIEKLLLKVIVSFLSSNDVRSLVMIFKRTIEVIISKFNGFNPGEYIYYKDKDDKIEYDKNIYGNDILTNRGIITVERDGITVYTTEEAFKDEVFSCYVPKEEKSKPLELSYQDGACNDIDSNFLIHLSDTPKT